jgi:hypothetical protein
VFTRSSPANVQSLEPTGTVATERVIVPGTISGVIRGITVALQASSHVSSDIHHISLSAEMLRAMGLRLARRPPGQ